MNITIQVFVWTYFSVLGEINRVISPPFHLNPSLASIDHFTVSVIFLRCHVFGVIYYVTFKDWFLSLSNIQLRLIHVFL